MRTAWIDLLSRFKHGGFPQELHAYARRRCMRADALATRRGSQNAYRHWKAVGRQETLRHVAINLQNGHVVSPLPLGPFPTLPEGLSSYQREQLAGLENALSRHPRVLVKTKGATKNPELMLAALDRMLQHTPVRRVLVLAGRARLVPLLRQKFEHATSLEHGKPLSELYPVQYQLTAPLADETRVCISSARAVQLVTQDGRKDQQDAPDQILPLPVASMDMFDAMIIYGTPVLSTVWGNVLHTLAVPYLIGFSSVLDADLMILFDGHVVSAHDDAAC